MHLDSHDRRRKNAITFVYLSIIRKIRGGLTETVTLFNIKYFFTNIDSNAGLDSENIAAHKQS